MTAKMYVVENYVLRYEHENQRPCVILTVREQGEEKHVSIYPPWEAVVYIADMLRNEKPVYWSPEGNYLTTRRERVGEEEGR